MKHTLTPNPNTAQTLTKQEIPIAVRAKSPTRARSLYAHFFTHAADTNPCLQFVMKFGAPAFQALCEAEGALFIAQVFSSGAPPTPGNLNIPSSAGIEHPKDAAGNTRDVETHKKVWGGQVREAALLKPVLYAINSHTGKDYFSPAEADDLFSYCVALEKELGVTVNHETHRARILYSPWPVPRIFDAHPELHYTADLSHFSVVTETGADDPEVCKVVAQITPRTRHVHARVGFQEGPQVPDPRGPLWAPYLEGYKKWWRAIYQARVDAGADTVSTTPEFGPWMYAWVDAHAAGPVPSRKDTLNNIWDINVRSRQPLEKKKKPTPAQETSPCTTQPLTKQHYVAFQTAALFEAVAGPGTGAKMVEDPEKGNWSL
jgi:hypothetical protein